MRANRENMIGVEGEMVAWKLRNVQQDPSQFRAAYDCNFVQNEYPFLIRLIKFGIRIHNVFISIF